MIEKIGKSYAKYQRLSLSFDTTEAAIKG